MEIAPKVGIRIVRKICRPLIFIDKLIWLEGV